MTESPKTDKAIRQEAFLGKMRQLGKSSESGSIDVSVLDLLGASTLFDVEIREDLRAGLIETLTKHKITVGIGKSELEQLDATKLKAFIQEWVMSTGVALAVLKDLPIWGEFDKKPRKN